MCATCGCGSQGRATLTNLDTGKVVNLHDHAHEHVHADGTRHSHAHGDDHQHGPGHDHAHVGDHTHHSHPHTHDHHHAHGLEHSHAEDARGPADIVTLEARVLAKNDALADRNRAWLAGREMLALNLMSSPGAGKTTLLERTICDLHEEMKLYVLEGDQATLNDGERIRAAGAPVVQVNTGTGCHLEADMVERGIRELRPAVGSVLFIENVGNLVCPALFDLGEHAKIVIFSITEGDDKPLKYPHIFQAAKLVILSKVDLLPHVDFDIDRALAHIRQVNPAITALTLSARTGEGLEAWYAWVRRAAVSAHLPATH
jgi:hydrogenase nickel incorporation protein HypB